MKLQFSADLDYQQAAIDAVCEVFHGQQTCTSQFSVPALVSPSAVASADLFATASDLGTGNRLRLLDDEILANVQRIQTRQALPVSKALPSRDFTVEMETGTGKTYVYLRSIYELNRRYGFAKFVIVVPSVAIREGVLKSLQITESHFRGLYANTPCDYFAYDSSRREQVRGFATATAIQIMVINIDAFRKAFTDPGKETKANLIHRSDDRMSGYKPIEFIQQTQPIVIIDEPQSVDTTAKSAEAISSLNPLCTYRYSATHRDTHHLLYRLDAIDAYEQKLVKQIEVAGVTAPDSHNNAYIRLLSVSNKNGISAKLEFDELKRGTVKRVQRKVQQGSDLFELSGGRAVYDGYIVNDIWCEPGNEYLDFTSQPERLNLGGHIGGVDDDAIKRLQMRKTLEEHLNKQLVLREQGIKVLSLFFIDKVSNYRSYDDDGRPVPGKYAQWFEAIYRELIAAPKYGALFPDGNPVDPQAVHNGYFAADRKGQWKDVKDTEASRNSSDAGDAYNLIMKDKERLLSLDEPLAFIFSHSALREGWDNPNVFQICTLNETGSSIKKRQEIGRGLRIAVNQDGERVHGFAVNRLTVMANESYHDFAAALQREIEQDEGIRFGMVSAELFAEIPVDDGEASEPFGTEAAEALVDQLQRAGYINGSGKVQDRLRAALKSNTVILSEAAEPIRDAVLARLRKVAGKLNVHNRDDARTVRLNKAVFLSDEFSALWDRIKYKTTFRVNFSSDELVAKCAESIREHLRVRKQRFQYQRAALDIDRTGVHTADEKDTAHIYDAPDEPLPDIVSYLQDETQLTRRSIVRVLNESGRLDAFRQNPQAFVEQVTDIIRRTMRHFIVDGIKYQRIGEHAIWAQELFEAEELSGYLNHNMRAAEKSVYDHVVYDSEVESDFAAELEASEAVKLYAKLPDWFRIDTPLGTYNPDWAIVMDDAGSERLYLVVETKGSLFGDALRPAEKAKIDCGKAHFKAMDPAVELRQARSLADV